MFVSTNTVNFQAYKKHKASLMGDRNQLSFLRAPSND